MRRTLIALFLLGLVIVATVVLLGVVEIHEHDAVTIVALAGLAVGILNQGLLRKTRQEVQTSNGDTLGTLVDSIHDRVEHIETKVDATEVQLREHLSETAPIIEFVQALRDKEEDGGTQRN